MTSMCLIIGFRGRDRGGIGSEDGEVVPGTLVVTS
jgi:hypothetical protein